MPLVTSGIGDMKHERIHAVSHWRNGPGCYDTLFISATSDNMDNNAEDLSTHGILHLEVAHAHLFFFIHLGWNKIPMCISALVLFSNRYAK